MIFPKDEGVGGFELGKALLWEKRFLNFLGKKTPKTTTFPSCGSVSPSLTIWIEQKCFWKPNWAFTQQQSRKNLWVWTFLEFPLSGDLNPSRFLFLCYDVSHVRKFCFISHDFSYLFVFFLNTISLNPILYLCAERPAMRSFWYFAEIDLAPAMFRHF